MKIWKEELMNVILNNDTTSAAEILEAFNITKDGIPYPFTCADKDVVSTMLGLASGMSYRNDLDGDLAEELIEHTAMTVDTFSFVRLVVVASKIKTDDFSAIPEEIRTALLRSDYTDKIAYEIEKLDDDAFAALLAFLLTGKVEGMHAKFNLPIIRRIHAEETIPEDLMLAYMGLCSRETIDKRQHGILRDTLSVLGGLTLLDALTSVMHDHDNNDEEGKEPEDDTEE